MHICIASDDNYYENLIVLLTSLVEKVPKTNHSALNIYLLVNEKYSKSVHTFEIFKDIKITYVRISDLELNDAKATSYFSEATYFKLFIDKFYCCAIGYDLCSSKIIGIILFNLLISFNTHFNHSYITNFLCSKLILKCH